MSGKANILLTGAAGFVGGDLHRIMTGAGFPIWSIVRSKGQLGPRSDCTKMIVGDIRGIGRLPDGIDTIIHAAASPISPQLFARDNVEATKILVDKAVQGGVRRFIFFSSVTVYGRIDDPVIDEETAINTPDPYGLSKLAGEAAVLNARSSLCPIVLRMPGILGPGAHRNWLSRARVAFRSGQTVRAFNLDAPFNNAVHTEDLAHLCSQIAGGVNAEGVFTLAADGPMSIGQTLELLKREIGATSEVESVPAPQSSWTISNDKAKRFLGYAPMHIENMLRRFAKER